MENKVNIKNNPVLLDVPIQELQSQLKAELPWLDVAYGRANRGRRRDAIEPMVYNDKGEYISMFPNDRLRAFSFFDIYDPQDVDTTTPMIPVLKCTGALVFWYDLSKIFADNSTLYNEELKRDILKVLMKPRLFKSKSRLTVMSVSEKIENIYKGYNIGKLDVKFLSYPFGGMRIEFKMRTEELCIISH